jgi:hypothetical protein
VATKQPERGFTSGKEPHLFSTSVRKRSWGEEALGLPYEFHVGGICLIDDSIAVEGAGALVGSFLCVLSNLWLVNF